MLVSPPLFWGWFSPPPGRVAGLPLVPCLQAVEAVAALLHSCRGGGGWPTSRVGAQQQEEPGRPIDAAAGGGRQTPADKAAHASYGYL